MRAASLALLWGAALAATGFGCGQEDAGSLPRLPHQPSPWAPIASSSQRFAMEPLGMVPNSGLLPPAVSLDGAWVACLNCPPLAPEGDALLTGKGLAQVSLSLRQTRRDAPVRRVCPGGTAWMAWSPDSRRLVFVTYSPEGRCELGIHDLASGQTRRLASGLKRMAMPALSPSGGRALLVDCEQFPISSRLFVLDLQSADLQPVAGQQASRPLWPQWIDEHNILYVDWRAETTFLQMQALDGSSPPQPVKDLGALPLAEQTLLLFAAIGRPLSPDGRQVALYDPAGDQIVLTGLAGGRQQAMETSTRAGCWLGEGFLAATDKDLLLWQPGQPAPQKLLNGTGLPLWADGRTRQMILCTRTADDATFQLVRVRLLGK